MSARAIPLLSLADMRADQEADLFLLLTEKQQLTTRQGKPYFKVTLRDATREISFPIWGDAPWAAECRDQWRPGVFYKVRAVYRETSYGPQLEIRKIREATEADRAEGFDPNMLRRRSRFDPEAMWSELTALVERHISPGPLRRVVETLLAENRQRLLVWPAARHNHHAYVGGWLEHTLAVAKTCVYLAQRYAEHYPELDPPLDAGLVVAGGILHDIGKLRELDDRPEGACYSAPGALVGHMLLGRDMVREAAAKVGLEGDTLLRLEHIVVAHQRLPEWGSPKPPMTPEALLVHYADDIDAKLAILCGILAEDATQGPTTSKRNLLGYALYRGPEPSET